MKLLFSKVCLALLLLFLTLGLVEAQTNVVKAVIEPAKLKAGEKGVLKVTIAIPDSQHAGLQEDYLYVTVDSISGIVWEKTVYPQGDKTPEGVTTYKKSVTLEKTFTIDNSFKEGKVDLKVRTGYQFCLDTGSCFMPQEVEQALPLTVLPRSTDYLKFLKFLLMAFVGGIILNVMPCVLPVLSIKALSIVKQSHEDKKAIMHHSFAYTAGILASFLILAVLVIVLKSSGELIGWGFQFQSPTFVIILLSVIFVFALSLFDVFIISAPGMNVAAKASSKGGFTGSFMSGVFAVVLATPCTAPLLGAALGFAFTQPAHSIILIFLSVGLGLALPFLILAFWPKAIKKIPRPGEWMNIFKEFMGFLLLATAIWLITVVLAQVGSQNLLNILVYLLVLALSCWLYGRMTHPELSVRTHWIGLILAVLILAVGIKYTLNFKKAAPGTELKAEKEGNWQNFDPAAIEKLIAEGKPVFIDFTAAWCMTCKVNENTVLYTDEIEAVLTAKKVNLFKADYTNKDEVVGKWIQSYGRAGVPVYAIYVPGETNPIVLPEIITKQIVLEALNKIK